MAKPTEPEGERNAPHTFRGLPLFPFQRRSVQAITAGKNVVVAAPTGAGKTLVADYAIEWAFEAGRRVVYTSPIKALSNQKYRDFREHYGDDKVGIMTGDVTIRPEAPLLVMTTEIFRNTIFEAPERLDGFDFVVFDEVHYLDDRERGTVWEESIIFAPPHVRIVALSATVPNVTELAQWIGEVRETAVEVIVEETRPVPLTHKTWIPGLGPRSLPEVQQYFVDRGRGGRGGRRERSGGRGKGGPRRGGRRSRRQQEDQIWEASGKLLDYLERRKLLPVIHFAFSRVECERLARANALRRELLDPAERKRMLKLFDELASRYEVTHAHETRHLRPLAASGVLYHHAGMLPIDKEIVERLFTTGLVKMLFATETFSLGVNMPARTVAFQALCKFDGIKYGPILARDYWQMAGRAGRQGIDDRGWVFALLDETRIDHHDLERLQSGATEPVISRFNMSYSGILNLYRRVGDRVADAWGRSFARFQRDRKRKGGGAGGARQIRARIKVLEAYDYIRDGTLTRKGDLCSRVNGYEIAATEAFENGWIGRCDPIQLVMLFAAMIYEPRRFDDSAPPTRSLKGIAVPFTLHMESFASTELAHRVGVPTRVPDFGVAGPVQLWAEGMEFDRVLGKTSLAPGDLVRLLRMTIQMLRQVEHSLDPEDPTRESLRAARDKIDRDVVDARRQLELG